jgi:hypothetical protein
VLWKNNKNQGKIYCKDETEMDAWPENPQGESEYRECSFISSQVF